MNNENNFLNCKNNSNIKNRCPKVVFVLPTGPSGTNITGPTGPTARCNKSSIYIFLNGKVPYYFNIP